jgi:hypothetical protein
MLTKGYRLYVIGYKFISAAFLLLSFASYSQKKEELEIHYAQTITGEDLKKHLSVLASDEYEGRETGEKGQKMAATYIAKQFKNSGLKAGYYDTSYFQRYPMDIQYKKEVFLNVNNNQYNPESDYLSFYGLSEQTINTNNIFFAGYGMDDSKYNDYKNVNVKDKVVLIFDGEPMNKDSVYYVSGTKKPTDWSTNYKRKEEIARNLDAKALLIVVNNIDSAYKQYRHRLIGKSIKVKSNKKEKIPVIFISEKIADNISSSQRAVISEWKNEIEKTGKTISKELTCNLKIEIKIEEKHLSAENVLGYIEGTDLKNELLVLSAHYDHLGMEAGQVFNGADDDGSGTVSIIELAQTFALAKKEGHGPRRSMLFITFSGEEKGLLGSEYYTDNPVYPLKNTIADLNIDMIGRVDAKHKDSIEYVYVIGSDKLSSELHRINENANRQFCKLKLDYTFNNVHDPNRFYYRSDHYNFAKNNIPVIFYFNGTHEDYHKETDEISKINFDLMEKRARLVFYTAWELANRDERIKVDVKQ